MFFFNYINIETIGPTDIKKKWQNPIWTNVRKDKQYMIFLTNFQSNFKSFTYLISFVSYGLHKIKSNKLLLLLFFFWKEKI